MKRSNSRPIILNLPTFEMHSRASKPRILQFHRLGMNSRKTGEQSPPVELHVESNAALSEVRERLFRMIVANQWDRSHGNRAS